MSSFFGEKNPWRGRGFLEESFCSTVTTDLGEPRSWEPATFILLDSIALREASVLEKIRVDSQEVGVRGYLQGGRLQIQKGGK